MKKKVLLSVFAASLFAAPVALAADEFQPVAPGPNHFENAKFDETGKEFTLADVTQGEVNDKLTASSKAKTGKANNATVDKDGVVRGKGKAMAPAKKPAGQKALPKTSAVK